ncbi:hypothetical protein Zmor_016957 [Zophobas morio]|uniref:Uncharacterized protein n=1 Tax=Zophobas morio TaxID=2755281 RepID=A0AA38I8I7_9CUCU|nr:hypothetical protein Zmor_016957 [Zophobas morio]
MLVIAPNNNINNNNNSNINSDNGLSSSPHPATRPPEGVSSPSKSTQPLIMSKAYRDGLFQRCRRCRRGDFQSATTEPFTSIRFSRRHSNIIFYYCDSSTS